MRVEPDSSRRRFLAAAGAFAAAPSSSASRAPRSRPRAEQAGRGAGARRLELPGFFDLQVNGFAGVDFGDTAVSADDVARAIRAIEKTGVTRFLATLITSSLETFAACARTLLRASDPALAGIHMEGP